MSFIRRIPLAMSALALGLAALGNLLAPYSPEVRIACGVVSGALVLLIAARLALDWSGCWTDLRNPATLAVTPAFPMALMVLATYLKPVIGAPGMWLWFAALALQLAVVVLFVARHVVSFGLEKVMPTWFLVFVGFVVASVTSPAFSMQPLGRVLLYTGLAGYAAVLVMVIARLVRVGGLPETSLPTVAIFIAPPSLCLVGYLAVAESKDAAFVYVMLALTGLSLLYVLAHLPRIVRIGFHPSLAALTFPIVISALALKLSAAFLAASGAGAIPQYAVAAMDLAAVVAVLYVLARYAIFLAAPRVE
jgi:exfoliative toxin A/B